MMPMLLLTVKLVSTIQGICVLLFKKMFGSCVVCTGRYIQSMPSFQFSSSDSSLCTLVPIWYVIAYFSVCFRYLKIPLCFCFVLKVLNAFSSKSYKYTEVCIKCERCGQWLVTECRPRKVPPGEDGQSLAHLGPVPCPCHKHLSPCALQVTATLISPWWLRLRLRGITWHVQGPAEGRPAWGWLIGY